MLTIAYVYNDYYYFINKEKISFHLFNIYTFKSKTFGIMYTKSCLFGYYIN